MSQNCKVCSEIAVYFIEPTESLLCEAHFKEEKHKLPTTTYKEEKRKKTQKQNSYASVHGLCHSFFSNNEKELTIQELEELRSKNGDELGKLFCYMIWQRQYQRPGMDFEPLKSLPKGKRVETAELLKYHFPGIKNLKTASGNTKVKRPPFEDELKLRNYKVPLTEVELHFSVMKLNFCYYLDDENRVEKGAYFFKIKTHPLREVGTKKQSSNNAKDSKINQDNTASCPTTASPRSEVYGWTQRQSLSNKRRLEEPNRNTKRSNCGKTKSILETGQVIDSSKEDSVYSHATSSKFSDFECDFSMLDTDKYMPESAGSMARPSVPTSHFDNSHSCGLPSEGTFEAHSRRTVTFVHDEKFECQSSSRVSVPGVWYIRGGQKRRVRNLLTNTRLDEDSHVTRTGVFLLLTLCGTATAAGLGKLLSSLLIKKEAQEGLLLSNQAQSRWIEVAALLSSLASDVKENNDDEMNLDSPNGVPQRPAGTNRGLSSEPIYNEFIGHPGISLVQRNDFEEDLLSKLVREFEDINVNEARVKVMFILTAVFMLMLLMGTLLVVWRIVWTIYELWLEFIPFFVFKVLQYFWVVLLASSSTHTE